MSSAVSSYERDGDRQAVHREHVAPTEAWRPEESREERTEHERGSVPGRSTRRSPFDLAAPEEGRRVIARGAGTKQRRPCSLHRPGGR